MKVLKALPPKRTTGKNKGGTARGNWKEWLDGQPRLAVAGKDFRSMPRTFAVRVYLAGKRFGVQVTTRLLENGNVAFQSLSAAA